MASEPHSILFSTSQVEKLRKKINFTLMNCLTFYCTDKIESYNYFILTLNTNINLCATVFIF